MYVHVVQNGSYFKLVKKRNCCSVLPLSSSVSLCQFCNFNDFYSCKSILQFSSSVTENVPGGTYWKLSIGAYM